jgi:multicomponent Na+:H+ antiporter subunit B
MSSLILETLTRRLLPLFLVYSVFLLLRGHNEPGGGFAGGLIAATGYALLTLAFGVEKARRSFHIDPRWFLGWGLLLALGAGVLSWFEGSPFLTGLWTSVPLGGDRKLDVGTPLLFDLGVYTAVLGMVLTILFTLEES